MKFFSEGTNDSQNLRYKTLLIADNDYLKSSIFAVLGRKLWLKENDEIH